MNKKILASNSEGRKEIFTKIFASDFLVSASNVSEDDLLHLPPQDMVVQLARRKGTVIAQHNYNNIVFAFDTTVACQSRVLGKPQDQQEAYEMLSFLNNKIQTVMTGYAFFYQDSIKYGVESATVTLSLSKKEIEQYILNHPVTKFAGSYAIQKKDTKIQIHTGTIDTIIGVPTHQVLLFLKEQGLNY